MLGSPFKIFDEKPMQNILFYLTEVMYSFIDSEMVIFLYKKLCPLMGEKNQNSHKKVKSVKNFKKSVRRYVPNNPKLLTPAS